MAVVSDPNAPRFEWHADRLDVIDSGNHAVRVPFGHLRALIGEAAPRLGLVVSDDDGSADMREIEAMSDEQVDAELRAHGGDPEAISARGKVLVDGLLAKRRAIAHCHEPGVGDEPACDWSGPMSDLRTDRDGVTHCPRCGSTAIEEPAP